MAQLTCDHLCLGYEGKEILHHLSFSVNAGDYLCIIGENGSGKTTLMKTLLGLLPPMSGTVTFGDGLTRTSIGYLPQQMFWQKDFPATVWEIVMSSFEGQRGWRPFCTAAEKQTARENIARMGIAPFARRCYRELSGGQQQRVLLARALCATRRMILLDEPVSGLDARVTAEMYRLIEDLNREGITVVMISHDREAALRYASHILHIGRTVFFGTREAYLNREGGDADDRA